MLLVMLALTLVGMGTELVLAERNLTDKTVLITGAARGIGYSIADKCLENGAKCIIIVDKDGVTGPIAAETLACKYGEDKAVFIEGDVRTDLEEVFDKVLKNYGCIDVLVNDAGVIEENNPTSMLKTNLLAVVNWSLKYRESMRTDQTSDCANGGVIINIASVAGHTNYPFTYSYVASKFGVVGFTRSLGHLYNQRQTGVDVIGVCPGLTHTNITENMNIVEAFQQEDFNKFYPSLPSQEPDAVGSGAVEIFKNAESGTIWDIVGGKDPELTTDLTVITAEYIDNL